MFERFLKSSKDQYLEVLGKISVQFDPSLHMGDILKAKEKQVNFILTPTYDLYLSTNGHQVLAEELEQAGSSPLGSGSFRLDGNRLRFDFSSDLPQAKDIQKAIHEKVRLFLVNQGLEAR